MVVAVLSITAALSLSPTYGVFVLRSIADVSLGTINANAQMHACTLADAYV